MNYCCYDCAIYYDRDFIYSLIELFCVIRASTVTSAPQKRLTERIPSTMPSMAPSDGGKALLSPAIQNTTRSTSLWT